MPALVHRAQALPQLVQPAAFDRHPEGSRLDEWTERRCRLLDGCGWQSLLIMHSAGRERRQLVPGIRGNAKPQTSTAARTSAASSRTRAAVTSNVQPVIRGSLRDGAGHPVAGGTVCIYETVDLPDASRELISSVTTQGNGRFATRLDAGPSRQLDLVYRYNDRVLGGQVKLDSTGRSDSPDRAEEASRTAMRRASGGDVPGPNADGRAVAMQARVGRKWRTFKQLRTDADGRFIGRYRFTPDDRSRSILSSVRW